MGCCCLFAIGQQPVSVGSGSYAEYTPLIKSKTDEHGGDKSRIMETREIYISDRMKGEPIPTNDWWTNVLVDAYTGNLWSYPQVVKAESGGVSVAYPNHWSDDGCEMKWDTKLTVKGRRFNAQKVLADGWSDWGLRLQMVDDDNNIFVTLAQGMPFTWFEPGDVPLSISADGAEFFSMEGDALSLPFEGSSLGVKIGNDFYGVYVPESTVFDVVDNEIGVTFADGKSPYLVVALLPSVEALEAYAAYAPVVPRNTRVDWNYDERSGKMTSVWNVEGENLSGGTERNVLQGFLPHHYKNSTLDFSFTGYEYATPRGKMKLAAGNRFSTAYHFSGILPWFACPEEDSTLSHPYQRERMVSMIADYAAKGTFGADTYWGGKGLIQMALNMTFALEMGEDALFEQCRSRLREAMEDWLTYTPGESQRFFARYSRWGALVGYDTSYDSDTFNDHHFHYGYYAYAGAVLALVDEDFRAKYGEMLRLLAKDYANWERDDKRFPLFRTFTPWSGHSYAGGLGNAGNGNGQESTSESMQAWGGMYLLGVALGDKEMRDAGIFGWVTESKGVAEYWFDRDRENINRSLYTKPYNSNLTAAGIGWWTWFSGDPVWMHSIQWMPISPCLDYLSEDLDFARWDYETMWAGKEIGGWVADKNYAGSALSKESGLGNVVLSYLQRFDADQAAQIFDEMWDAEMPVARNTDTNGITYYITHSHRTYGDRDYTVNADITTASAYCDAEGHYTYVVYNAENDERQVTFYRDGSELVSFKAPAGKLTVYSDEPQLATVEIINGESVVAPGKSLQLKAELLDQYGATTEGNVEWSVEGSGGTVDGNGLFTAGQVKGETCKVVAVCGGLRAEKELRIDDEPVLHSAAIEPQVEYAEAGTTLTFSLNAKDQYGNAFPVVRQWRIKKDGNVVKNDSILDIQGVGIYTVEAVTDGGKVYSHDVYMTPPMENLALHKRVKVSSYENVGTVAESATDGDYLTRWGSQHTDDEWIYVDLGTPKYVSYVTLYWEAAYASLYEIQVSDDASDWTTVAEVSGGGGVENVSVGRSARYVKMQGKGRATTYGYSLYELEVHGIDPDSDPSELMGIEVTAPSLLVKEGESVQLKAVGYDGRGEKVDIQPQWSVESGKGEVSEDGIYVPVGYGTAEVTATVGDKKATVQFVVEESIKPRSVEIYPQNVELVKGESVEFSIEAFDQFSTACSSDGFVYACKAVPELMDGAVFNGLREGEYEIIVSKGAVADTAYVKVGSYADVNLALNKPVTASSYENDLTLPEYVNDGDLSTRWGSAFDDNQFVSSDLEMPYVLNRIVLHWNKDAYATDYRVEVSDDEMIWKTVYQESASTGGTRDISFANVAGQYVRIYCMARSSQYGSCLDEVEVYGKSRYENPVASDVQISLPDGTVAYIGEPVQLKALLTDQYGLEFAPQGSFVWDVSNGNATVDAEGVLTPVCEGECVVTVGYESLTDRAELRILAERKMTLLQVFPPVAEIEAGVSLQLEAVVADQYGNTHKEICDWECSGGTCIDGAFVADEPGTYQVTALSGGLKATATVEVVSALTENIALNRPAEASSGTASAANDDNTGTRWESDHVDGPEWLMFDLQGVYHLMRSEIQWEAASAADYEMQVSLDGEHWQTIVLENGLSGERTDKATISAIARYVRLWCTKRALPYGYSVWEWQLFGREMHDGEACEVVFVDAPAEIPADSESQFTVAVKDVAGQVLTDVDLTWAVTGGGAIRSDGHFDAVVPGDYTVTAWSGLANASHDFSVVYLSGVASQEDTGVVITCHEGRLNIHSEATVRSVAVYSLTGSRQWAVGGLSTNRYEALLDLPDGVYVVVVQTENGYRIGKIMLL